MPSASAPVYDAFAPSLRPRNGSRLGDKCGPGEGGPAEGAPVPEAPVAAVAARGP